MPARANVTTPRPSRAGTCSDPEQGLPELLARVEAEAGGWSSSGAKASDGASAAGSGSSSSVSPSSSPPSHVNAVCRQLQTLASEYQAAPDHVRRACGVRVRSAWALLTTTLIGSSPEHHHAGGRAGLHGSRGPAAHRSDRSSSSSSGGEPNGATSTQAAPLIEACGEDELRRLALALPKLMGFLDVKPLAHAVAGRAAAPGVMQGASLLNASCVLYGLTRGGLVCTAKGHSSQAHDPQVRGVRPVICACICCHHQTFVF